MRSNISKASENGVLKTGFLFVALAAFRDGSPIDKQMKHSESPLLLTMINLTLFLLFHSQRSEDGPSRFWFHLVFQVQLDMSL
jgi:hypothetical protein